MNESASVGPAEPPRVLQGFLSDPERERWLAIAGSPGLTARWVPGRQGSGYEKVDLLAALAEGTLDADRPFVETQLDSLRNSLGVDSSNGWDAYLLRYGEGAFVPEHRDPTTELCHLRLNAIVQEAASGTGLLYLDGEPIRLAGGDAVLFRPDVLPHRVSHVEGRRFVLSVGCVFQRSGDCPTEK
jgi:hypothetical protein